MQCVVPVPKITQWDTLRLFLQRRVPSSDPPVVFSYSNGQEQPDHQAWAYKNRCRLFKDNLTVSLSHVSPSDQGEYDCKIFLWGPRGHQLEYTGQLLLSIWGKTESLLRWLVPWSGASQSAPRPMQSTGDGLTMTSCIP